jgi:hypothetical protein
MYIAMNMNIRTIMFQWAGGILSARRTSSLSMHDDGDGDERKHNKKRIKKEKATLLREHVSTYT